MSRYRRLSLVDREELSRMLAAGSSLRAAGRTLRRAPSTLARELSRHHASPETYRAVRAHQRAQRWAHRPRKPRKLAIQPRLRRAAFTLLARRWSPEQLARGLPPRYPQGPTSGSLMKPSTPLSTSCHRGRSNGSSSGTCESGTDPLDPADNIVLP